MDQLISAINLAWQNIRARVESDPAEFARRLARRRSPTCTACPRAWCLAIRASDRRISPTTATIVPEHAVRCDSRRYTAHDVTLDPRLLRLICRPVHTDWPYTLRNDLARRLGVPSGSLGVPSGSLGVSIRASDYNHLRARKIKGLGGQRGYPVPVVYSPNPLDPSYAWHFQTPHHAWGTHVSWLADHVPDDLHQLVRRIPRFRPGGHRKRPHCRNHYIQFFGFRWVCPSCGKKVRTLFYPMPGFYTLRLSKRDVPDDHPDAVPPPPKCFACHSCHRVRYFELTTRNAWNYLVAHLSGGLLYGREVPRPDWLTPQRKRKYRPQIVRTSPRREQVLKLLLAGLSRRQIADEMSVTKYAIGNHIARIYALHRVHNRAQLARFYNRPAPTRAKPRNDAVESLLLQGLRYEDIANRLDIGRSAICFHATHIYRRHQVKNRRQLAAALGASLPSRAPRRAEVLRRHRIGQSFDQIARAMGITRCTVWRHVNADAIAERRLNRSRSAQGGRN